MNLTDQASSLSQDAALAFDPPRMHRVHRLAVSRTGFVFLLALSLVLPAAAISEDICGYPVEGRLAVSREGRTVAVFRVGLAENRAQYKRGLMECPGLAPGSGLLFVYPEADRRLFWMKNTPLALAIVFAGADGRVKAVAKGEPNSTRHIPSPAGIRYVLEIAYEEIDKIRVGDRLVLRLIPQ